MTFEPSDPIAPTPTTTRVGSGTSARLIALAVAAVLVGGGVRIRQSAPAPTGGRRAGHGHARTSTYATAYSDAAAQPAGRQGRHLRLAGRGPTASGAGPRGPGLFNRCRWEVGPQAAPPRGNPDEAGCLAI